MTPHSGAAALDGPVAEPPPGAAPIRVVIADDHRLYRQSLRIVLTLDGDIAVVGEASNGREAVEVCRALRPDVLVMDVQMPRLGGVDALMELLGPCPDLRIIMLTMSEDPDDFLTALKAGVSGYLLKDAPGEVVARGIRRVHDGGVTVSERAVAALLDHLSRLDPDSFTNPEAPVLIDRLREVVRRVGLRTPEEAAADRTGANPELSGEVRALLEAVRNLPVTPRTGSRA